MFEILDATLKKNFDYDKLQKATKPRNESVYPRQIAHYFAQRKTFATLTEIGDYYGGKSHATVLYSIKNIRNLIFSSPSVRKQIKQIELAYDSFKDRRSENREQ